MNNPLLYFVHIPKTGGITLKAYLEDHYPQAQCFVVNEWVAPSYSTEQLRHYRYFSGHYPAEVLRNLERPPDLTVCLVRNPLTRFTSQVAHWRRLKSEEYRDAVRTRSDLELMDQPTLGRACFQAHFLARSLRDGMAASTVPTEAELPELLGGIGMVGLTEELVRFKQLVSFHLGWPPPPANWRINRDPGGYELHPGEVPEITARLSVDYRLYELATQRFWGQYGDMLADLGFSPGECAAAAIHVPVDVVQQKLRERHRARLAEGSTIPLEQWEVGAEIRPEGEGWWWRENPCGTPYRWSGPELVSTVLLPRLVPSNTYELTLDAVAVADMDTFNSLGIEVNGTSLPLVRQRLAPSDSPGPSLRLFGRVAPSALAARPDLAEVTIRAEQTKQALAHVRVTESFDTDAPDHRHVGIGMSSLRLTPIRPGAHLVHEAVMQSFVLDTHASVASLPGWLNLDAAQVMGALRAIQVNMFPELGSMLEIGIWEAQTLVFLAALSSPSDVVLGIDPFCHSPEPDEQYARALATLSERVVRPERVHVLRKSSRTVSPAEVAGLLTSPLSLVHVDGDHTFEGCLHDLELSESIAVAPGTLIVVDDVANLSCPGVIDAVVVHLRGGTGFEAVATAGNKLFLAQWRYAQAYRDALVAVCGTGLLGDVGRRMVDHRSRMGALNIPTRLCGSDLLVG